MKNLQAIKQRFGIIGFSSLLERALATAIRVAPTDLTVLITGESGVGKEVFSKIIHELSPRKHNKFIAINCGAIPSGTINSELFGHKKGAFTGATADRKGYFETVSGGTIFLDEIGELPLDTQSFLLRILESGEFIPVGSSTVLTTDVRIIAASNVDLEEKIRKGKFREDLYYRLKTVPITVPALKDRTEDISMLFRKFAIDFSEKYGMVPVRLEEKAEVLLKNYRWPGNIRELKNLAEQISVLSEERVITAEILLDFLPNLLGRNLPSIPGREGFGASGAGMEEREILYKLLFDMKHDLNDLKSLFFELIKDNDLRFPKLDKMRQPATFTREQTGFSAPVYHPGQGDSEKGEYGNTSEIDNPVIITTRDSYQKAEVVEEDLSIEKMEKELIVKALKKYRGRRRDAAKDLGISERTLYRKIKQYEIEE